MTMFRRILTVSAFCALWAVAGVASSTAAAEGEFGRAPDFTVRTLDGEEVSRASLLGKVVVVNFWATWCPDCRNALPGYIALQKQFADEAGFVFLAIALDERPADDVRKFAGKHQINYRIAMGDEALTKAFGGIAEIPTTFVIDRSGVIRFKQGGAVAHDEFMRLLRTLL